MHTYPGGRTLLAFGDSNTFGIIPGTRQRYRPGERWTGVLQRHLGVRWDVVESGLPGRTTDLEDVVFGRPDRAGWPMFRAVFESVVPDVVVLSLGTNDLRLGSGRSDPEEVASTLARYVEHVVAAGHPAGTVIVAAPPAQERPADDSGVSDIFGSSGRRATAELVGALRRMSSERGATWFDVTADVRVGADGAHLDAPSHHLWGERLAALVRNDFPCHVVRTPLD